MPAIGRVLSQVTTVHLPLWTEIRAVMYEGRRLYPRFRQALMRRRAVWSVIHAARQYPSSTDDLIAGRHLLRQCSTDEVVCPFEEVLHVWRIGVATIMLAPGKLASQ